MSTRSEVKIIGEYGSIKLYHHHDGYPEGVGFDLMNRFWKDKSDDRKWEYDSVVNALIKDTVDEYEVTQYDHTDREYEYEIDIVKKTIRCWECDWDTSNNDWKCEKGKEVDLVSMWQKQNIKDKLEEALEKYGFKVEKSMDSGCDISQYTPAGEDWHLEFGKLEEIIEYAKNYDPNEDFALWYDAKRKDKSIPDVPELWKDQVWKQETLNKVVEELQ